MLSVKNPVNWQKSLGFEESLTYFIDIFLHISRNWHEIHSKIMTRLLKFIILAIDQSLQCLDFVELNEIT